MSLLGPSAWLSSSHGSPQPQTHVCGQVGQDGEDEVATHVITKQGHHEVHIAFIMPVPLRVVYDSCQGTKAVIKLKH